MTQAGGLTAALQVSRYTFSCTHMQLWSTMRCFTTFMVVSADAVAAKLPAEQIAGMSSQALMQTQSLAHLHRICAYTCTHTHTHACLTITAEGGRPHRTLMYSVIDPLKNTGRNSFLHLCSVER